MNRTLLEKKRVIFSVNLKEKRAVSVNLVPEQVIEDVEGYFEDLARKCVDDMHKEQMLNFMNVEKLRQLFTEKEDYDTEIMLEPEEGDEKGAYWVLCELELVSRDENGNPEIVWLYMRNIDEPKRRLFQEESRRQQLELMTNRAFEHVKIMKFTYYIKEGYGISSRGLREMYHLEEQMDDMPESFRDRCIDPEYYEIHNALYARCVGGEEYASCELRDIHGQWSTITLEVIERDEEENPAVILGIMENTDELHKTRDEAKMMEEVCRFAILNHYEEASLVDVKKDTVKALIESGEGNDVGFHHGGDDRYTAGVHKMIEERAYEEKDKEILSTMLPDKLVPLLQDKGEHEIKVQLINDHGQVTWKLVEFVFYKGDENLILLLGRDVQEEENVKEQLREAAREAKAANQAKTAFLANMSHEIRTPMNAIVGLSEILLGKPLPEDVLVDINTIQNSGSSLLAIINDILDFSKIETGKFEIHDVPYLMPSVLMDISNVIVVRLAGHDVHFMMDIDPNLPMRYIGDDVRIKQILLNLVGNAVKFTQEGYIRLVMKGQMLNEDSIELTFKVEDTGIGIREEDIGKLFQSFSQVDTKKNRQISGSGLGLSISRNLAQMMGGDLTVKSEYGKGSTFTVRLIQKVKDKEPIGEVGNKERIGILICERNEAIIHSLSSTMKKLGLRFEVCREPDKVREFEGMTHVLIRRKNFPQIREKLEFMFEFDNIFLILENDEHPESFYMKYKQIQLPLISLQIINALNGDKIVNSVKRKTFDRSQIIPLPFARVLIVDDNTTNLQVAQGLMSPYKMKIDTATSGFKAIEMVKAVSYHAIFMDHMMPEMDGIEATRHIRNLQGDYYKTVPIIALTANAMSDAKDLFLQAGMDDFVAKPIEMTELNRVLKRYVQPQAPEGYMDKINDSIRKDLEMRHSRRAGIPQLSGYQAEGLPGSRRTVFGGGAVGDGFLGRLLEQNNALLSQNMILLRTLVGEPAGGAVYPEADRELNYKEPDVEAETDTGGTETMEGEPELYHLYEPIEGIDSEECLNVYGGSVAVYHDILKTYYSDISEREGELTKYFERQDIDSFTICVHAVKGASRGVGANRLAELAQELELDGQHRNWDGIKTKYGAFHDELLFIAEHVGHYVEKYLIQSKSQGVPTSDGFPRETVNELVSACEDMDYMKVEDILSELNQKRYPEALEEQLDRMIQLCRGFEYDKLEEMILNLT